MSGLLDMGRTDGLCRYKTEDSDPCPDGTLLGMDGKLGDRSMMMIVRPMIVRPMMVVRLFGHPLVQDSLKRHIVHVDAIVLEGLLHP